MPDFPIIDAHVHLYDPSGLPYAWLAGAPPINKPHLPADFDGLTAPVKIDGIVFVEVDVDDPRYLDEARWVEKTALSDPRVLGMVAGMPLEKGVSIEGDIAEYAKLPHARGVRRLIQKHAGEPGWCLRPDFVAAVKLLPKYGLSFDICIFHSQMRGHHRTGATLSGREFHSRSHRQARHQGRDHPAVAERNAGAGGASERDLQDFGSDHRGGS